MALISGFNSLLDSIKLVVRQHTFLFEHFENEFRNVVSSCALQDLVCSTIPKKTIHNALISSLESTSRLALEESARLQISDLNTISEQLWNPLTASLIKMLINDVPLRLEKDTSTKKVKKQDKTVSKALPKTVTLPGPVETEKIRSALKAVALTRTRLYENTSHIQCDRDNCGFCRHMFNNVNITRCEGHKRCCASGWYPHVGKPLWSMLKAKHAALVPCKLKPQACKSSELPALQTTTPVAGTSANFEDVEFDDVSSHHSNESVCTVRSTQSVPLATMSWAEDVEDFYLKRKTRRLGGSNSTPGTPLHHSSSS